MEDKEKCELILGKVVRVHRTLKTYRSGESTQIGGRFQVFEFFRSLSSNTVHDFLFPGLHLDTLNALQGFVCGFDASIRVLDHFAVDSKQLLHDNSLDGPRKDHNDQTSKTWPTNQGVKDGHVPTDLEHTVPKYVHLRDKHFNFGSIDLHEVDQFT